MKNYIKTLLKLMVSLLLIGFLIYKIGAKNIWDTLLTADPVYIILIIVTNVLGFVIASISVKLLLMPLNVRPFSFLKLMWYNTVTYAVSKFMPGRIGDFSIIYFLKKEGINIGEGFAVTMMDKVIISVVHIIFAAIGLFIFFPTKTAVEATLCLIAVSICLLFAIIWRPGRELVKKYILRKYADSFKGFYRTFSGYYKEHKMILITNFIVGIVKNIAFGLVLYLAIRAFGIANPPSLLIMMVLSSISNVISLIPITLAGLGAKETLLVFVLGIYGIPAEIVMGASLMLLAIRYLSSAWALLMYTWFDKS